MGCAWEERMARVLVTAARGNVGREVAQACSELGFVVRVADRKELALREQFPKLEVARFDFLDSTTWTSALDGCEYVFLLRPPPVGDMEQTLCPFVDVAYAAGVQHIVFLSVAGADRMKWVPHRKVELHLQKVATAWTILRPGFFAQNLQDAYRRDIFEDGRIYVPAGQGRVAFIDVRDVADVAARVFQDPSAFCGQALTLTGPEAMTFDTVATQLSAALGMPIRYEAASILGYAWHLYTQRDMPWMQILIQTILHVGLRRGDAARVDRTLSQLLGRPPRKMEHYIQGALNVPQLASMPLARS